MIILYAVTGAGSKCDGLSQRSWVGSSAHYEIVILTYFKIYLPGTSSIM